MRSYFYLFLKMGRFNTYVHLNADGKQERVLLLLLCVKELSAQKSLCTGEGISHSYEGQCNRREEGSKVGTDIVRFVDLVSGKLKFMTVPIFSLKLESVGGGEGFTGLWNED